tara:strand:- start:505 stop:924 length:420 start_codon:yes stop_codon:yes gene_type:complete
MNSTEESLFDKAMVNYQNGAPARDLIKDFEEIIAATPNNSAAWTCLAWLQLLCDEYEKALKSARSAVKLNGQDPQARINLTLALLETNSKGVRENIDFVKRALFVMPELEKELKKSIEDGLQRKSNWLALNKVKTWLDL